MTARHEIFDFVRQAASEMAAEYERIHRRAGEDPGTAGDEGEENWAELLRLWLPATHHVVTKGRVLASNGKASRQVDVLILSPAYPTGLLGKKLYLASGVYAAFECKMTLKSQHIRNAVRGGVTLRELARGDSAVRHDLLYGLLAHSHSWKRHKSQPVKNANNALIRADEESVRDPREMLDVLCVADLGTWAAMRLPITDEDGSVLHSTYMAPWVGGGSSESAARTYSIGRFLTYLVRRLGSVDPALSPLAEYLHETGLFGTGQGAVRRWPLADVPPEARTIVW